MKSFDFNKGFVNESKQQINEMFGTLAIVGILGMFLAPQVFSLFGNIREVQAKIMKSKAEREKARAEYEKNKEEARKQKEETRIAKEEEEAEKEKQKYDEQLQKTSRMMLAYKNSIETMPDGPDKVKAQENLDNMTKVLNGKATKKELENLEKAAKAAKNGDQTRVDKFMNKIDIAVAKIPQSEVNQFIQNTGISMDGVTKTTQLLPPPTNDEAEDKTDDELKQEIKDLKDEEQIKKLPDSVKTEDGKIDPAKVDQLSGDDLKNAATAAGISITKPKPAEPKPAEEEDKTDDELKQEIKDLKDEEQIKKLPDSVKTEDGKIDPAKVDQLSGDDLKNAATAADISTKKPKPAEPKPEPEPTEEKDEYTYLDKDDNEIVVKREKQEDGTYKYTKTVEGGEPTPASEDDFNKAKAEEGEENTDADERTDNDDDLEDEDTTGTKKQDPHKIWKRRTYKRGNKTFKTKSFYDKKGNSISTKEFKEKVKKFKANESYVGGWRMTPLFSHRPKKIMVEAKADPTRESICKDRLVYIKYVIDTTVSSVEKTTMERMYDALYNITFNSSGKLRSLKELYNYLNQVMIENSGKIPGLPNNNQIETIDKKCDAWKISEPSKYESYMKRLEKSNLDKQAGKTDDKAKDILNPSPAKTDTDAINKIREMSSTYGFTNILGLEKTRKASVQDVDKKDAVSRQQKSGSAEVEQDSKDVKPEDVSDEQIEKIVGVK